MRSASGLLAFVLAAMLVVPGQAQTAEGLRLEPALGVGPGVGGRVAGVRPFLGVFTAEGALYADYEPRVVGGEGRLLVAVGVGGAVRALRLAGIVREFDPGRFELDLGARFGPAFYYAFFEQSAASEARAFRIVLDPFARGAMHLARGRTAFVEIGPQAPSVRGGLVFALGD